MISLQRIYAIAYKEIRQLKRDRLTFGMIVGIPLIQMMLFGYAINTDVRHLTAAVADQSNGYNSRALVADLIATQVIDVGYRVETAVELEDLLRRGTISVGVLIPRDFDRRLYDRTRSAVQLLVDGSDPVIVAAAQQLTGLPIENRYREYKAAAAPVFELRSFYNPEHRSAVNIVPALIGVILTMTMSLFTAVAIVRELERGNLELLITTPVLTLELMIGKIMPYIVIGLLQVTIVLLVGVLLFHVPIRGSVIDIYSTCTLFIGASLTIGVLISTIAKTQFQAMQLTFFFFLPSLLLSGFMFPFDGMPKLAQHIGEIFPLTHFVRIIRGIILRGADFMDVWPQSLALIVFMLVTLALAILRFRKRLD